MSRNQNQKCSGRMDRTHIKKGKKKISHKGSTDIREAPKDEVELASSTNDPAWYAQTPELMALSANIPFSQAAGTKFNLGLYNDASGADAIEDTSTFYVPGIMTMNVVPVPSSADSPNAPLNIAATKVFSFVRHANSGTPQYNSPDLMLYMISMGQVYSYINFLQRIYGCMNLYANMNRYLPRALVSAQYVNYDNVISNLPNFKYGIDALIHKASSLAVPANLTYFQRLAFMFSGVYAEGESVKDQLYMYNPQGFMQYSETASETGGSLQYLAYVTDDAKRYTYSELLDYGDKLLDPIIASEDMNIMSGDILKAYGDAGILKLSMLPDAYMIVPTTDLNVLEQFQNAIRFDTALQSATITQSQKGLAGSLVSKVTFNMSYPLMAVINGNKLLTTILTAPGPGDVMERTRLMGYGSQTTDTTPLIQAQMATEVPTTAFIWRFNYAGNLVSTVVPQTVVVTDTYTPTDAMNALELHCLLENFKFHPNVYYFRKTSSGTTFMQMAVDIDNYAIINVIDLNRMNEAALLSMFNTNSVAKAY